MTKLNDSVEDPMQEQHFNQLLQNTMDQEKKRVDSCFPAESLASIPVDRISFKKIGIMEVYRFNIFEKRNLQKFLTRLCTLLMKKTISAIK